MKFTHRGIDALKAKDNRYIVWQDNGRGFGLRVTPKGVKTFVTVYRFNGKAKMLTHGQFPKLSLAEAGVLHAEAIRKIDQGIDPSAEKALRHYQINSEPTIEDLANSVLR